MRALKRLFVVLCSTVVPTLAFAQSSTQGSIVGVVKDASTAVLPGVTVDVSSPKLIEKVRTAVTDGSGQYKIVDRRHSRSAPSWPDTAHNPIAAKTHIAPAAS